MIHYGGSHWGLGVLVGYPVLLLILVALFFTARWFRNHKWDSYDDKLGRVWVPRVCFIIAVIAVLITAIGSWPYKAEYHKWQNVDGVVTSTNSRFLASGDKNGGTNQKFVVTFKGSDQQFGCNDTRCATVEKGDWLKITCMRSFQWFGTPGYDCNFVDYKSKTD